jgi:hypothetical protein
LTQTHVGKQISFLYGDQDWMTLAHAVQLRDQMNASMSSKADEGDDVMPSLRVATVGGAGHNMMIDNPLGFVDALLHLALDPRLDSKVTDANVSADPDANFVPFFGDKYMMRAAGLSGWDVGAHLEAHVKPSSDTWQTVQVRGDNNDGTYTILWKHNNVITHHHPGHRLRALSQATAN